MNSKIQFSLFLLMSSSLLAFQDSDLDGVEDSLDLCPNTSFELLVNKNGCASSQNKNSKNSTSNNIGALTFTVGTTFLSDENYDDDNYLNLYANYRYKNWDVSLSNSRSTNSSSYTEDNSNSDNDFYISTGYTVPLSKSSLKLSIGAKIVDDSDTVTTTNSSNSIEFQKGEGRRQTPLTNSSEITTIDSRDNDYFASINYNYQFNSKQNAFAYYGYTLAGDSNSIDYEDYSSFSIGTGYALNESLYTALSYNYTGSIYENSDAEERVTWFNSYRFTKNIFANLSYSYGLDDYSYDHSVAFALGLYLQ